MKKDILNFIILPGNPGIGEYYSFFQKWLQEFFPGSSVDILSYRGFQSHPPERLFTILEEKEDLERRIVEKIQSSDPNRFWILIGHSIGGWVVLEILSDWKKRKHPLFRRVKSIFLLFPFLALDPNSEKQTKLEQRINRRTLISIGLTIYRLIRYLPRPILRRVIRVLTPGADEEIQKIHEHFFLDCSHIPASVVYCARSEFALLERDIAQGLVVEKIRPLQSILHIFYTNRDIWAPIEQQEFLKNKLDKRFQRKIELIERVHHDFCIRSEESFRVAKRIYDLIKKFH